SSTAWEFARRGRPYRLSSGALERSFGRRVGRSVRGHPDRGAAGAPAEVVLLLVLRTRNLRLSEPLSGHPSRDQRTGGCRAFHYHSHRYCCGVARGVAGRPCPEHDDHDDDRQDRHRRDLAEDQGQLEYRKGAVKEQWGKLTDDDLMEIQGRRDQLVGKIQMRYGISQEQAEAQVSGWEHKYKSM